jgi:DNA-binding protein H-NS
VKARKSTKGRSLGKVAPKYRNPANTKETWAGRGKQPRWLSAETAKGRKLEEFLIK